MCGRLGGAHEHLRAASGGGVRHRRAEAPHAAAADRRRGQGLLRRHRAERRAQHDAAQDARRARAATTTSCPARRSGSRPRRSPTRCCILARTTPLDEVKRRTEGLSLFYTDLDRSRVEVREIEKMGRNAVDSNEMFIDGMAVPVGRPHRRGGRGLPHHPARHEPRAHPDRRRGGRPRPRGAAARRGLRARARRVRPADRPEPGRSSIRWRNAGWSSRPPT